MTKAEKDLYHIAILRLQGRDRLQATEIADLLDMSRSTVSMIISTACEKMHAHCVQRGLKLADLMPENTKKRQIITKTSINHVENEY